MKSDIFEVIEKFQEYLTKTRKMLQGHLEGATEQNYNWEVEVTEQRINDLFLIKYRLEQLLNKAGYEDLCTLAAFNEKARQKLEKK